ncbi:MAG TPA: transcription antitermination factor NusB [Candidatus Saccharimonadales bacterium]
MASNRHLGRIVALQTLYEYEFRLDCKDETADLNEILQRNVVRYEDTIDDTDFVRSLTMSTQQRLKELDEIIQPIAPEWPIAQIARVDRSILRLALNELIFGNDVPPKVVINEAVELAKAFGSENSSRFINGVLGTAFRQLEENRQDKPKKKKPAKTKAAAKKPAAKKTAKRKPAGNKS